MTRDEFFKKIKDIGLESQKTSDRELYAAGSILRLLLGSMEAGKTEELYDLVNQFYVSNC